MRSSAPQPRGRLAFLQEPTGAQYGYQRRKSSAWRSSSCIMERHFAYQTLGAVSPWIPKLSGKNRVLRCQTRRSGSQQGGQAVLVGTQLWDLNMPESLNTCDGCL